MFTGLIETVGRVAAAHAEPGGLRLEIAAPGFPALAKGASVAIQGCCQTVSASAPESFQVRCMDETLRKTTLGALGPGARVNLERSLRAGQEIGGHLVSGHVDGVGVLREIAASPSETRVVLELPEELARFIAPRGSLCVDGVSLTVVSAEGRRAAVHLIPYTREHTVAGGYREGDRVNVEVDLIARYVARLLEGGK